MNFDRLFKKSVTGKILVCDINVVHEAEWSIVVNTTGYIDGEKTTHFRKIIKGKNKGKKNETSIQEQAIKEAQSMYKSALKDAYFYTLEGAEKGEVDPKFVIGGFEPMLAKKYDEYKDKLTFPLIVQPKLDGIRACISEGRVFSRTRKEITSQNHILEALRVAGLDHINFDGELYNHDLKDDFESISSGVRVEDSNDKSAMLQYHIYDVQTSGTMMERWYDLQKFKERFNENSPVKFVNTYLVNDQNELDYLYKVFIQEGYEGQMIRTNGSYENKRSKFLLKRKEWLDEEFLIVDMEEGTGHLSNAVGSFWCVTNDPEHRRFRVTPEASVEQKSEWFRSPDLWLNKLMTVRFLKFTVKNKVPKHAVGLRIRDPLY